MKTLDEFFSEEREEIGESVKDSGEKEKVLYGYKLPEDWEIVKWGDIATPLRQKIKRDHYKGEYPIVSKIPFDKGKIELRDKRETRTDLYVSPIGTLVVSKINLHQGAVAINDIGTITCTTHYDVYRINDKKADIVFIWYFLRSPVFRKMIYDDIKYRGFKKEANYKYLKELALALPPLEEQKKIVYVLRTIQRAMEQQDKIIETTKELKRSLMHRLFTRGLDASQPTKQTEIGEVPEHWEVVEFGNLVVSYRNGIYKPMKFYGRGYPCIRMYNISDGYINKEGAPLLDVTDEELEKYGLKEGDIIINRVNTPELVGKAGIIPPNFGKATFESKNIRVRVDEKKLLPLFFVMFAQTEQYFKQIRSFAKVAIAQATITQKDLNVLKVPLPPLEEQKQIVQILQTVDRKIEIAKKKKEAFQNLFKTMLHKLMTAQIRVKDLEIPSEKIESLSV